jgi:hypothetical protein
MSPKAKTTPKDTTKPAARRGRPPKAETAARRGRPPKGAHGGARKGAGQKKTAPDGTRTESFILHPRHSQILDAITAAMGVGTSRSDALRTVIIEGARAAYDKVTKERRESDAMLAQVLADVLPPGQARDGGTLNESEEPPAIVQDLPIAAKQS